MVEKPTTGDIMIEMKRDVFKILLRPKHGTALSQAQVHNLFESIKEGKVIYIPSNLEIISIRNNGTVKVY